MEDCPICLEKTAQPQFPFSCGHPSCRNCSRRMSLSDMHRCPTCRAPREGMTAEQAAPREEPLQEIHPYASLFRWTSHHAVPQAPAPQPPQRLVSPMAQDFAVALMMVQQERESRVPLDLTDLDDETRDDIRALSELPVPISEWQRRRREQSERRERELRERVADTLARE